MNQKFSTFNLYPELLDDLLNLEYLIVFNNHGLTLFSLDIGKIEIPDLLISGLLQAIITMLKEFKPSKMNKKENRLIVKEITDGDYGFLVYYCQSIPQEDTGIVLACFCSKLCSDHFKSRLKSVTSTFADKYQKEIVNFNGNLSPFERSTRVFFEETMWINYLFPLQINNNFRLIKESDQPEIINLIKIIHNFEDNLIYNEGFYLKEIVEKALRTLNISYFEVLKLVIDLINDSFFTQDIEDSSMILKSKKETTALKNKNDISRNKLEPIVDKISKDDSILNEIPIKGMLKLTNSELINEKKGNGQKNGQWVNEFIQNLNNFELKGISNKNVVISSLIREIEYEFLLNKHSVIVRTDKESIIKELTIENFFLEKKTVNLFSGPKLVLKSKLNEISIITGIKFDKEYIVIQF